VALVAAEATVAEAAAETVVAVVATAEDAAVETVVATAVRVASAARVSVRATSRSSSKILKRAAIERPVSFKASAVRATTPSMQTLTTARLKLHDVHVNDLPDLRRIIQAPGAAEWWGDYEGSEDDDELLRGLTIFLGEKRIGWIGYEEETAKKFPSVGLDIMIDPDFHGEGYGPEALRGVIDYFIGRGHHRFTIDPSATNTRAIHSYEKAGFKPIGIAREYEELTPGTKSDGLLMDLIARDLE
jgi:aminoglycoside 6'-N-acetyltransferase